MRARFHCPTVVLVLRAEESIARWSVEPIEPGGGSVSFPLAVGPSGVPVVRDAAAGPRVSSPQRA